MDTVTDITMEILKHEGSRYVNDPNDPGGPTRYGVTIHTLRSIRGSHITAEDVKNLTIEEAVTIFKRHYYHKPRIDSLPSNLQATVYDMQVNAGNNAIKILQRVLNEFGCKVTVDGAIGPQSIAAAAKVYDKVGDVLVNSYGIARRNYYFRLGDRRPPLRTFCVTRAGTKGGWIKRAESFIDSKYHMSESDFKERILQWES